MSLKSNITANFVSQIYVAGIGILVFPMYVQYMGGEVYGLVGFFTMLQAWFGFLDMGLTPTIGRETARYHGGSMDALKFRQLFRALSLIFAAISVIGGSCLWLAAGLISDNWLKVNELALSEVILAVQIMAICVALRWVGGLYRGVITGSERMVWLSAFNAVIATLRFIVVFVTMWAFGFTPFVFFTHQLVVALLEVAGLLFMSYRLLPSGNAIDGDIGWSFEPVKPVLRFALTVGFTQSVWVLVTQTDKLVLSGILPLAEYGYFTLAVLVASGILVISAPISMSIMPRMARLHAEYKRSELIQVYRNATQLVSVISGSAAITIAVCAQPLLYAWTGNLDLAIHAAPILRLYAIGNGFLALATFAYYLQYARGNLRYHLIGNALLITVLVPAIAIAAMIYGGIGAAYVWVTVNGSFLMGWVGFVHGKLEPGMHLQWFRRDIANICFPVSIVLILGSLIGGNLDSRLDALVYVVLMSASALTVGVLASTNLRGFLINKCKNIKKKVLILK